MIEWNSFDAQIYSIGKGPTQTTVMIQNDVIASGTTALIKGTVMDTSPGTENSDRQARFANGVPAIADENMSVWMEYVYMQQNKPSDIKGVTVKLTYTDASGNVQDIGTTTSDASGNFAYAWQPPATGTYAINAIFEGSDSYFPSSAETFLAAVTPSQPSASIAPTLVPTTQPPTEAPPTSVAPTASPSPYVEPPQGGTNTVLYVGIAAVVIIAILAAIALILRRRK